MHRPVGSHDVYGVAVDSETRCAHYDSEQDVVALKFGCCETFFSCYACHEAVADHTPQPWPRTRFDHPAVLCGSCRTALSVTQYLSAAHECPACGASFNPGCAGHYDRYFEGL
jgi:uncharacterized CHY-type Zn-finger protein